MSQVIERQRVWSTSDPRLDWVTQHDHRSKNFRVGSVIREVVIKPKKWEAGKTLDQGQEGACVGFGWVQEFMSAPRPFTRVSVKRAEGYAREFYKECQRYDEWEGEAYEGTSVLAGAQTAMRRKMIEGYRWCFSIEEVRDAVVALGPVVIGIPWYSKMYQTRSSGLVEVGGDLVGGHCILVDEYHPGKRITGEDYEARFHGFGWHNSWGEGYGVGGRGFIRYEDLRDLLSTWGEACVPMNRKLVRF